MRYFYATTILIFSLLGCTSISREAGYPGGNVGYLADRHALFAKGQQQRVNRYMVTLALLAPLMAETAGTSSEARLSAERVKDLYDMIKKLGNAAEKCNLQSLATEAAAGNVQIANSCSQDDARKLEGSGLSFETMSFEVSKSLNDALKQAFDNLEIRANASRVVALEPTEMLKTLLKARHLVPVLLRYLATYRDVTVVFGLSVAESCSESGLPAPQQKACAKVDTSFRTLSTRTQSADVDVAHIQRPLTDVLDAGKAALDAGLDWKLNKIHTAALIHHVNRACKKLDAFGKIDNKDFKGCTIEASQKVEADTNAIIENAPPP